MRVDDEDMMRVYLVRKVSLYPQSLICRYSRGRDAVDAGESPDALPSMKIRSRSRSRSRCGRESRCFAFLILFLLRLNSVKTWRPGKSDTTSIELPARLSTLRSDILERFSTMEMRLECRSSTQNQCSKGLVLCRRCDSNISSTLLMNISVLKGQFYDYQSLLMTISEDCL